MTDRDAVVEPGAGRSSLRLVGRTPAARGAARGAARRAAARSTGAAARRAARRPAAAARRAAGGATASRAAAARAAAVVACVASYIAQLGPPARPEGGDGDESPNCTAQGSLLFQWPPIRRTAIRERSARTSLRTGRTRGAPTARRHPRSRNCTPIPLQKTGGQLPGHSAAPTGNPHRWCRPG
jgi:hypothetical protein